MFHILFFGFYLAFLLFTVLILKKLKYQYVYKFTLILGIILFMFLLSNRKRIQNRFIHIKPKLRVHLDTPNSCSCSWVSMTLFKNDYHQFHLPSAIATTQNQYIENESVLKNLLKKSKLVEAKEADGFFVQRLDYSSAILTPLAYKRLIELGNLFRSKIKNQSEKKSYFVISSITRTENQQKKIIELYPNAATRGKSTHSYGVSFDISLIKAKKDCSEGLTALQKALTQMQKEKKVLLCPESKCIHITIIR